MGLFWGWEHSRQKPGACLSSMISEFVSEASFHRMRRGVVKGSKMRSETEWAFRLQSLPGVILSTLTCTVTWEATGEIGQKKIFPEGQNS